MVTDVMTGTPAQDHRPDAVRQITPFPLENGDRLTRSEFERRYEAMPNVKKAELIEGIVHMPSPIRYKNHGEPHSNIHGWLFIYRVATPGVGLTDNSSLRLDLDNEPQPNLVLRIEESCGGRSYISDDDYLEGSPELVVEVSSSSASYDLHEKLNVYRRNGIQEYLVWRVYDRQIDWFELQNEQYIPLPATAEGIVESRVFPGLRLNVNALLSGELNKLVADLQQGLHSETHAAFVRKLIPSTERR